MCQVRFRVSLFVSPRAERTPRISENCLERYGGCLKNPSQECKSLPLELRARATPSVVALEFGAELH